MEHSLESAKKNFTAVVAMSENRVIGDENSLPWYLPADLQHFKKITLGHPILMGRKTYESIGQPLPQRTNIILTRNIQFSAPGCVVLNTLDQLDQQPALKEAKEIFVIGGAEIYRQLMPEITRIYMTVVHEQFEGDAFFPELDMSGWQQNGCEFHEADEHNEYDYSFLILDRRHTKK